jgi:hypothetical protein
MLSDDELKDGMPFLLQLQDSAGVPSQWMETFRGDLARRWYEIYRTSDWQALRAEALGAFQHSVTEAAMDKFLEPQTRCIFIHTPLVKVEELQNQPAMAACVGKP